MNDIDSSEQKYYEMLLSGSTTQFVPISPNASETSSYKASNFMKKPLSTKTMMVKAIMASSTDSRKGFSLAKIRKYIVKNFLHTDSEAKNRIRLMKKFFRLALESGDIVSVKGSGLTGSFRVPPKSPLHKNVKENVSKVEKKPRISGRKSTKKRETSKKISVVKPKKMKEAKTTFPANK